jgi:phosphate:Na+ symporter
MTELNWGVIITQLGGGLALFLYGMRQMTESLKTVAGGVITAVIQSSSVTTVLVVGFISAGLLQFGQSVGVILGANVGTTVTAQIIAFQVYKYGLLLIAAGFFTEILAHRERVRQWGTAAMGLGLIFFGMELMSIATGPFRDWPPFIDLMQGISNPAITVAIGAVFTAIVQSSSATAGIVIVLASQGLISLESGIGIIFGANIGTCVTAFASAFGRPREALQAAWAHLVFNVAGVLLWVFFIGPFADLVRTLSPVSAGLTGLELAAADVPRQIANAHTLFNFANMFLFIWFTGPLARLIQRIVPIPPAPEGVRPKYLDDYFLTQPSLALDLVRKELTHLGELTRTMIDRALATTIQGSEQDAATLSRVDDDVDVVYGDIIHYLGRLSQQDLITPQPKQLQDYIGIANYLENIGDVIDKDLLVVAAKRRRKSIVVASKTREMLQALADEVSRAFDLTLEALESGDPDVALEALESKSTVVGLADEVSVHIARRLIAEEPHRLETFQVETDIIELYLRLNTLSRRIARLSIDASIAGSNPDTTEEA